MSKVREKAKQVEELLDELSDSKVNGNFNNDSICDLYDRSKQIEELAEDFRKGVVKPEGLRRLRESGLKDEDDHPVLQGNERSAFGYAFGSTQIDAETVLAEVKKMSERESLDDALSFLSDLLKSSPFKKSSIEKAMNSGDLPVTVMEKNEADHSNPKVFKTNDETYASDEIVEGSGYNE